MRIYIPRRYASIGGFRNWCTIIPLNSIMHIIPFECNLLISLSCDVVYTQSKFKS